MHRYILQQRAKANQAPEEVNDKSAARSRGVNVAMETGVTETFDVNTRHCGRTKNQTFGAVRQ